LGRGRDYMVVGRGLGVGVVEVRVGVGVGVAGLLFMRGLRRGVRGLLWRTRREMGCWGRGRRVCQWGGDVVWVLLWDEKVRFN
jgi:hypothetical protein